MLVDNPGPMSQPSVFAPPYADYTNDLNEFLNTDLFTLPSSSQSQSSGSRESTPSLLTPPQGPPTASFPDINDPSSPSSLFGFIDEDVKALDPLSLLSTHPYDLFSPFSSGSSGGGGGGAASTNTEADISTFLGGAIDPQLMDSPAAPMSISDFESEPQSPEEPVIVPVKVGGHGKARKGTVVGGGVKKASVAASTLNKENTANTPFPTAASTFKPRQPSQSASAKDDDEDDDDVPADWRPPPEVFAKMSSKEKRQLRNKISARNFRVRRKEYITTLEDNIAERDRLLDAIRSELGSTQSENLALRQEIAALKRTLLENRGPAPVLPPPAPLSVSPASPVASTSGSSSSSSGRTSPLPAVNAHKDVSATNQRFWGGVNPLGAGGYTSVHTARIPDVLGTNPFASSPFAGALTQEAAVARVAQNENLNPALNGGKVTEVLRTGLGIGAGTGAPNAGAANGDAFGDANPFTVRNLDAYRMHLWGRMAAQYKHQQQHGANNNSASPSSSVSSPSPFASGSAGSWKAHSPPQSPPFPLHGLAGKLGPKYFQSPTLSASSLESSFGRLSLSGKGSASGSSLPPSLRSNSKEKEKAQERERETAMYAALASQTLVKRLGSAFWDAFSGAESSSSSSSSAGAGAGKFDVDKVRRVLEGKAVVRVVDVEPPTPKIAPAVPKMASTPTASTPAPTPVPRCSSAALTGLLEESMRSLSLGKKGSA